MRTNLIFARLLFFYLLFIAPNLAAQNNKRAELEIERQRLMQQIKAKQQQLSQTKQNQSATREQLETLQEQLENRESLINNLHEEIAATDEIVERTEAAIAGLESDRKRLQTEYALMMRRAYKSKIPSNAAVFMMSGKNFDESYQRWQYFQQYDKFRKRQARRIIETEKSLQAKNALLVAKREEKSSLVGVNEVQKSLLTSEKKQKNAVVEKLKAEENSLQSALKSAKRQSSRLNSAISNLISAEIESRRRTAEERARQNREAAEKLALMKFEKERSKREKQQHTEGVVEAAAPPKKVEVITESSENLALSSNFRSNKGKLPPPATGEIIRGFGKQKVLDKVTAVNNGIDIKTNDNADVKAVFSGTVSVVSSISGLGNVILIQHGTYYSVYSNLATVFIKKGETVSTRQTIGHAGVNPVSGQSEIHFEIWLERTQLNPSAWLAR
ncbi:MAG: peptidoglycan DD-metalloendopeptidase family protein [Saprospiraceae bacterium]|nr:peptidoglycan DD-metalloendopeptidase family protein [Saprospiraceae bacterium]